MSAGRSQVSFLGFENALTMTANVEFDSKELTDYRRVSAKVYHCKIVKWRCRISVIVSEVQLETAAASRLCAADNFLLA